MGSGRIIVIFIYKHFVPPGLFLTFEGLSISSCLPIPSPHLPVSPSPRLPISFLLFNRARPIRSCDVYWLYLQTMPLRVLDESKRLIETHRLIVQNRGRECRKVMTFEISAGVGD